MDRRTVVVALASLGGSAALLLSGCGPRAAGRDADSDAGGERSRADEDERLVDAALRAEFDLYSAVERTRRRHRSLRAVTEGALAAHRAHVVLLSGTTSSDGPPRVRGRRTGRPIAGRPAEALAALSRLEGQMAGEHIRLAMAARSGALARVVASMAAASAQLEQVLAQASPGAGAGKRIGGRRMTPLEALQETLAAEHVAVYTYGVVGGRLSAGSYPETSARFRSAYDAHRARRDQLRSLVSDRGADPEPPAAAYVVDAPDRSVATLTAAARRVELRCAEVYSQLVASTEDDLRRLAISLLTDASLRSLTLGAPPQTWPGAPDL